MLELNITLKYSGSNGGVIWDYLPHKNIATFNLDVKYDFLIWFSLHIIVEKFNMYIIFYYTFHIN